MLALAAGWWACVGLGVVLGALLARQSGQSCGCTACGGRLRSIGADVSEHLEYVPARSLLQVIKQNGPLPAAEGWTAMTSLEPSPA